ncbi:MAG: 4-alpha-glucanotransferase, partial [Rhodocyclales bacterium]|nr:4-alpha-glucanotransferase [Rhodocyclales bacterium]
AAQALVASEHFQARLRGLRASELVDYASVATAKREVIEVLYRHFYEHHLQSNSARAQAFRHYRDTAGDSLEQLARFDAIQGCMIAEDKAVWGWPAWPERYHDPAGPAVAEFATAHAGLVTFHAWLQWLADEQLAEVSRESRQRGLGIGLYVDLAVGANPGGAEAWRWQHVFADAHAGAPPDDFSLLGQDWGVPTFAPRLLREAAYAPLIELLRANMRHTGALRIDHVMGLTRLFWVPAGETPTEGTYVAYPLEELLGIVALESQRNRCLVIGEDLGTVPDGLRDRLAEYGFLSYRPLLFERDGSGNFKPPTAYPRQSLACAGTHDLPTLAGMWAGTDLAAREALGMFPSSRQRDALLVTRAHDRARLLEALARERLLPEGIGADPDALPRLDHTLATAIHAYLARTPAQVMMVQPEDVLGLESQANLPGSRDDQQPNWRRRLTLDIEDWPSDPRFIELWDTLRHEHRCAAKRMEPRFLLERLDGIARSLEQSGHALALIGLGSVGREVDRLDAHSDLDFFAIAETGHKWHYLDDLSWLSALCPIAYHYANTRDGYKILFDDGIFCEFAVFEPEELRSIPFAPGRIVWKQAHVPETICLPAMPTPKPEVRAQDWLLGEALTNLLVGLARERRGESLSAMRFIQGHAVDRTLELADWIEAAQEVYRDPFAVERRFERRYPAIGREVGAWLRGYEGNRESALAILTFLERHFAVNAAIAAAIRKLCAE